jgi:hypothetical protein
MATMRLAVKRSERTVAAVWALAIIVTALFPATASARDPGRWFMTGHSMTRFEYYQGITSGGGSLYFDGVFVGLYRTTAGLRETARTANVIPADVTAREGYNHIGDLTWDQGEGGRVLLPLECFLLGAPNGPNTCRTGSIGVADPVSLRWRYYVKLDPADIPKAMWAEVSPDGKLLWTSAGSDLLAYSTSEITPAAAAPVGPLIRPVRRLAGAVPPSGITGATFYRGRLLVAGQGTGLFQVWSIDLETGTHQLEIEREIRGESEGLDVFDGLGGILHWQVEPLSSQPTYGFGFGALLHFVPANVLRIRLRVAPSAVAAGARRRFAFRASILVDRRARPVQSAEIRFAGHVARTNRHGRVAITARLPRAGRYRALATKAGLRRGAVTVRVR